MMIERIHNSTYESAALVAQRKLYQASELLNCIIGTLQKHKAESVPDETCNASDCLRSQDIALVPISKNYDIAYPNWYDEFFSLPFTFVSLGVTISAISKITDETAAIYAATCLYNLALCYHLEAMRHGGESLEALMNARSFYEKAWGCLKNFSSIWVDGESSASFLLMAISINMSKCCYYMGDLDASNRSMAALRGLLGLFWFEEDFLSLQLHNFFLLACTINTGCIAAAAA